MATKGFVAYTEKVKTVYFLNDTLDVSGLVVKAIATDDSERQLASASYSVNHSFNSAIAGSYALSIVYGSFEPQELTVTVISEEVEPTTAGVVKLLVDKAYAGAIGSVNGDGCVQFNTITQALDYIGGANYSAATEKVVYINAGTYKEKLTIPSSVATYENITLIGQKDANNVPTTILTYDDYSTKVRFDGVTCGTDTSASVTIKAKGFSAKNITFANSYGADTSQALALLVEADMATFTNCHFLGWQDTLEAKAGRQFYLDCYIEGCTDFIFGNNATVLFKDCTIHSLKRSSSTNNGYVCATKGLRSNASQDAIKYGYIFLECTFEADSAVEAGTVSLARPWMDYSKIAIINCLIGGHISKRGYGEQGQTRYTPMNAAQALPTSENVVYIESGNTGDGALTVSVAGCTVADAATVADYIDMNIIFGTVNGNLTYPSVWDALADMDALLAR